MTRLFVTNRLYYLASALAVGFVVAYFIPLLYPIAKVLFFVLLVFAAADVLLLLASRGHASATRKLPERFSNGDDNEVQLLVTNHYRFAIQVSVLDEVPAQFQLRNLLIVMPLAAGESRTATYSLRPTVRGEYSFGNINLLATTGIGLLQRRIQSSAPQMVKVYPSFVHLRKYELMAFSQQSATEGQRKLRRIGHSVEFDHIKEYTPGDDPRHLNWQATARRRVLMVNHYVDEKSQAIYNVVDKSRPMKMPFAGLTLLDYAINASLAITDIALKKGDRVGLATFQHRPETLVAAQKGGRQLHTVLESLYHEDTDFNEHNFGMLYAHLTARITSRSLLLIYTNFESQYSLERQLKYLKMLNRKHLVLVIIFRNTELDQLISREAPTLKDVYEQAIAQNMVNEKFAIMHLLRQSGILGLYTSPGNLTVDVINKYLELKSRRMI